MDKDSVKILETIIGKTVKSFEYIDIEILKIEFTDGSSIELHATHDANRNDSMLYVYDR